MSSCLKSIILIFYRSIGATDNVFTSIFSFGEGRHNYHHVFPWDYKTSEQEDYAYNFSTAVIDFFAKIGWAYDLKTASKDIIKKRVLRTGDGTHPVWGHKQKQFNECILQRSG